MDEKRRRTRLSARHARPVTDADRMSGQHISGARCAHEGDAAERAEIDTRLCIATASLDKTCARFSRAGWATAIPSAWGNSLWTGLKLLNDFFELRFSTFVISPTL
jgi:hypothetical protein